MKENDYSDIQIGQTGISERKIHQKDIDQITKFLASFNPKNNSKEKESFLLKDSLAQNQLAVSIISSVAATKLPGPGYIVISSECKFEKPIEPNDVIKTKLIVTKKINEKKIVILDASSINQNNEVILSGKLFTMYPEIK